MSCKELFDNSVYLCSTEKVETHNFNFDLVRIEVQEQLPMYSLVGTFWNLLHLSSWDHLWPNNTLLYYFSFLSEDALIFFVFFSLQYVLGSVTNSLKKLSTIPSVCCYVCPPFLKNSRAFYISFDICFEKPLFLEYFLKNFKIFKKIFFGCNSSLYFEKIVVCNEPLWFIIFIYISA